MDLDSTLLLYRVAKYYYFDNYSQQEIAHMENISRSQISRLLKKARDTNMVKIDISLPNLLDMDIIAKKLQNLMGLKKVSLTSSSANKAENNQMLYLFAANYITQAVKSSRNIGIGWGETLYNISLNLSYQEKEDHGQTFCALVGTSGTNNPFLQTNNIVDRFAEKLHAKAYYNNLPACISPEFMTEVEKRRLNILKKEWETLDTAVVGLGGSVQTGELYMDDFYNPEQVIRDIKSMHGDILGNFFGDNQLIYELPDNYISSSMDIESLRNIQTVICIAHGKLKVNAIISAARQGYIKELITDEATGKLLLEHFSVRQTRDLPTG